MRRGRAASLLPLSFVLGVALAVRVVFAAAPVFLEGDSQSYLLPGLALADGSSFDPELRRGPAYPSFVAASFALLGPRLDSVALAQHALGLATVGLTFLIGRRLFGVLAGTLAALAVGLSGAQLIYERYVMSEALFGLLLAGSGLVVLQLVQRRAEHGHPAHGHAWLVLPLLAGATVGLAALTRPVAQAIVPLYVVAVLLLLPRWRAAAITAGLVVVGYGLVAAPWAARNLLTHETPSTAGGLGRSLIARTVKYDELVDWKWLSETYDGRDDLPALERMLLYNKRRNIVSGRSVRPYQDALVRELGLTQGQAERTMRDIALESIARRPVDYLVGSLRFTGSILLGSEERLQSHWKQRANKDWAEQWDDRLDSLVDPIPAWDTASAAASRRSESGIAVSQARLADLTALHQPARFGWLVLALSLAGCLIALRERRSRAALLLGAVTLSLAALSAFLDGPVPRYRHPLDPFLSILAAGGLVGTVRLVGALARRRGGSEPLAPPVQRAPLGAPLEADQARPNPLGSQPG